MDKKISILVAGIAGASLGTEIVKCLKKAGIFTIFGCDISEFAYGHYQNGIADTFLIEKKNYLDSVMTLCKRHGIEAVVPGGEEPLKLLSTASEEFKIAGIHIVANSPEVVRVCSNKQILFERLEKLNFPIPKSIAIEEISQLEKIPFHHCVIKPATDSGGSNHVFLAADKEQLLSFTKYLLSNGKKVLVQEYIPADEGEFTIGVLSLPGKELVGSIAMQRILYSKLSLQSYAKIGLVSSGYSQGLIDDFKEIRLQAEKIAAALGSSGPFNVQGRLRNGTLLPFEINPRFSASTYLRALAGFNEIELYLRYLFFNQRPAPPQIRPGYYLRSFSEVHVEKEKIKR